jgi:hypothetical protein
MAIEELIRPEEELKYLKIPGKITLDFEEGEVIPAQAYLTNSDEIVGLIERKKGPFYCEGRHIVEYSVRRLD